MIEVLDRVSMQVFVRWYYTMIAAPVQCDVDGIPKGSHYARVPPMREPSKEWRPSLRSEGVRVHPAMPFGFPSETDQITADSIADVTRRLHSEPLS